MEQFEDDDDDDDQADTSSTGGGGGNTDGAKVGQDGGNEEQDDGISYQVRSLMGLRRFVHTLRCLMLNMRASTAATRPALSR